MSLGDQCFPEKRLEHGVAALAARRRHGSDGVEHHCLHLVMRAEETDHGLGHHLHFGRGRTVVIELGGRHHHRGVARLQQRLSAPGMR